jgi:hypothetical protein
MHETLVSHFGPIALSKIDVAQKETRKPTRTQDTNCCWRYAEVAWKPFSGYGFRHRRIDEVGYALVSKIELSVSEQIPVAAKIPYLCVWYGSKHLVLFGADLMLGDNAFVYVIQGYVSQYTILGANHVPRCSEGANSP